ncbi:hypothetical protein ACIF80_36330 [Streptomyces sp. NPDC085927]|uniref:hypothetical protein n=1 Tax=Streptomyces sp. NPDC085927 TaxID=3365738 RepID=UPI0037CFA385
MKNLSRRFHLVTAAGALLLGLAVAPAAHADSAYGCIYPQVCVYDDTSVTSPIVGRFQQVTSSWQYLSNPQSYYAVYNSRNDDVAYVLDNYGTHCIEPNGSMSSSGRITAIRIDSRSSC